MLKKIIKLFTSVPVTLVGGAFLILSFVLSKLEVSLPVDPAWITVVLSGLPLLYSAVRKLIKNRGISKISSALLISAAMVAAIAIGDLFAAGEVAFIMALGEILEDMTTDRARKGLKKLIGLAPTQGRRITESGTESIDAKDICVGDVLRVLPGEAIPADGVIVSGETSVDQSVVTGESMPVDKTVGEEVYCGTVNRFGSVDIKATKVGSDSSLQKLIRMVREAEDKKAPMARTADKCASWLVPLALLIAVVTGLVTKDIVRAVTVLVVFCPCALVLATPTAIMAAVGQATKHGVIIKSGEALEKMGKVDTVAFDKTGTLTYGKPEVSDVVLIDDRISVDELLFFAAAAESRSEHPLGKAIVAFAKEKGISAAETDEFRMCIGKGVTAKLSEKSIICGNEKLTDEVGVSISEETKTALEKFRSQGKASVIVAIDKVCAGVIALSDVIKEQTAAAAKELNKAGAQAILLTGDNEQAANYFAQQAGITQVYAGLLPEQKVEHITALEAKGKTVCMVGDGVNDAPALKSASVGVAMGSMGSDIAVESADIALMSDDISKIPYLKRLSVATVKTIKFSIALSMVINLLAVVLSVLGLLGPTSGALVHNAGSCFVVLIAALLYDRKFK